MLHLSFAFLFININSIDHEANKADAYLAEKCQSTLYDKKNVAEDTNQ